MGVKVKEKPPGSGVWWVFINHHGRRKAKKCGSKKLANEAAKKIEAKLTLGDLDLEKPIPAQVPNFGEYAEKYLAFIQANRRESTYERYDQVLKSHVLPAFRNKSVDAMTRGEIRDLLIAKSANLDVSVIRDVISGVLGFALDDEFIKSNPVTGLTTKLELRKKDKSEAVDPFTEADLALLLETCQAYHPEHYPFFFTACRTGMRLGELLALRWGDLDFSHKIIHESGSEEERPFIWVRQAYRRGRITAPKNGKTRKVDMSGQLKAVLKEHLTMEKKRALKEGRGGEVPELVFDEEGRNIEQKTMQRVFRRILAKAGLKQTKFHTLRHTFASLLLSMGESPVYVKEQVGHSSIQITVDIYGKWIQTKKEAGVNRLDNATKCNLSATSPQKTHLRGGNH